MWICSLQGQAIEKDWDTEESEGGSRVAPAMSVLVCVCVCVCVCDKYEIKLFERLRRT